jgi:hypothetical protein
VDAQLKWPNDVLAGPAKLAGPGKLAGILAEAAGPGKLAGILAEAAGDAVVVGIGVNVSTGPAEFPPPGPGALPATSLLLEHARSLDRTRLLAGILAGLERSYLTWSQFLGDPERIHPLVRDPRPSRPGRTARRPGSGRPRRGRRRGRQAAGQRAARRRPAGGRGRHRAPALNCRLDKALCAVWPESLRSPVASSPSCGCIRTGRR